MTREEMIDPVERIMAGEGDERHHDHLIEVLEKNVPHPRVTDLIYRHEAELSAAEVVDIALSYTPFAL